MRTLTARRVLTAACVCVLTVATFALAPSEAVAARNHKHATISDSGATAQLPDGWRKCGYALERVARCNPRAQRSHAEGGFSIRKWTARYRGDTCMQQNFTDGSPGPTIHIPESIVRAWHRHGWHTPAATRTTLIDQSGAHQNHLLYILCARTGDRRVVHIDYTGPSSQGGAVLTRALWSTGNTIRPDRRRPATRTAVQMRRRPVYLPGGYPEKIKPPIAIWSGDGTLELRDLHWSSWSRTNARGRGTVAIEECNSNCTRKYEKYFPARFHAFDPRYLRCGVFFDKTNVTYTARVSKHDKRHWTFKVNPSDNALEMYTIGPCSS